MPDSNRRRVERLYELFNARDVEAMLELAAPDIEWDWSRSIGPDKGISQGREAVRRFVCEQLEMWETIEMIPEEIIEVGDEVFVWVRVRLHGRDAIEVEARGPHIHTWRNGLLTRYRLFQDRDQALAAVGLSPTSSRATSSLS